MIRSILIVYPLLLLLACNGRDTSTESAAPIQEGPATSDSTASNSPTTPTTPPKTRQDTLMLEGMAEPVELRLYQAPEGWPLQVHTYLPPGIEAETVSSGEGEAIRFRMGEALLSFVVHPETVKRSAAQARARSLFGRSNVQSCRSSYPWQWECLYVANDKGRVKRVLIGEQQGRQFYFLLDYPAEWGDGFGPRVALILDEWRFDQGKGNR